MSHVTETTAPDQAELLNRQAELKSLEKDLSEQELTLATLRHQVRLFESAYDRVVAPRLRELDALKAKILDMAARLDPKSETLQAEAEAARERVLEAEIPEPEVPPTDPEETDSRPFDPEDSVKKLFREAAKRFHPDLSTDPEESARRHEWMAKLNQAYLDQDADRIRDLIDAWEAGGKPADPATLRLKLARVLKQVAQVRHRLHQIQKNIEVLRQSDMARLMEYAQKARAEGRDVLKDIAQETQEKIDQLKNRISLLASDCSLM